MARHTRRIRLPLLLPARLRLRLPRARPRRRGGGSPSQRPGGGRPRGSGRRPGRVPAALRGRRLLGSRPDPRRSGGATPGLGRRRGPGHGVESGGHGLHGQAAQDRRAPRAGGRRRHRAVHGGRRGGRAAGRRRAPARCRFDGWQGRARRALANRNAGDVLLSAAEGVEFADLGGRHHAGGGSHGSLLEGDSLVPMLAVGHRGTAAPGRSPASRRFVLGHFGIEASGREAAPPARPGGTRILE